MRRIATILLSLIAWPSLNAQETDSLSKEFDWSLNILDRWLIDEQPVCVECFDFPLTIRLDSTTISVDTENNVVKLSDIMEALNKMSNITGIGSSIEYSLGIDGVFCVDCSSYESDRKKWIEWFEANGTTISQ